MFERKGKKPMTIEEVAELMSLKGWSKTDLASALEMSESAIWYWFRTSKVPGGPTSILMRIWLEQERRPHKKNGRKVAV